MGKELRTDESHGDRDELLEKIADACHSATPHNSKHHDALWHAIGSSYSIPSDRRAMSQYNSTHFVVSQLEDGWMLQSEHVTKIQNGDWILDREELEELSALLQSVLTRS
jgi:hypothetical protein